MLARILNWKWLVNRSIPAGDPAKLVWLRTMDITGPELDAPDSLYLRRLYVFRCQKFGVMLHQIHREDWDRDGLHCHPWNFRAKILKGGYTEQVQTLSSISFEGLDECAPHVRALRPVHELTWRRGSWHKFGESDVHRISSVQPGTISLVINGPKFRTWGFFVPSRGIVPWREYLQEQGHPQAR